MAITAKISPTPLRPFTVCTTFHRATLHLGDNLLRIDISYDRRDTVLVNMVIV